MRSVRETAGAERFGGQSAGAQQPALAYARALLDPEAADTAVQEALDIVASTGAEGANPADVLAILRHAVARRAPRPAPAQVKRRGLARLARPPRPSACSQMPELLAARAASALSPGDVSRIAVHLDNCVVCTDLEQRMAAADEAFWVEVEAVTLDSHPAVKDFVSPPDRTAPVTPEPVTWAGAGVIRKEDRSDWLPEELEGPGPAEDITITRGAATGSASAAASAWLIEPDDSGPVEAAAFSAGSSSDWVPSEDALIDPELAAALQATQPPAIRRRRPLATIVPVAALLAMVGGALAASGVLESGGGSGADAVVTTSPPKTPPAAAEEAGERDRATAERRSAERRAARSRAQARRRAAARRRAVARRRAATAPPASAPVATPAPPQSQRPATPTDTPPGRTPIQTTPGPTQTTPVRTTPPDTPKPSAPSSEPGRQAPPTP